MWHEWGHGIYDLAFLGFTGTSRGCRGRKTPREGEGVVATCAHTSLLAVPLLLRVLGIDRDQQCTHECQWLWDTQALGFWSAEKWGAGRCQPRPSRPEASLVRPASGLGLLPCLSPAGPASCLVPCPRRGLSFLESSFKRQPGHAPQPSSWSRLCPEPLPSPCCQALSFMCVCVHPCVSAYVFLLRTPHPEGMG